MAPIDMLHKTTHVGQPSHLSPHAAIKPEVFAYSARSKYQNTVGVLTFTTFLRSETAWKVFLSLVSRSPFTATAMVTDKPLLSCRCCVSRSFLPVYGPALHIECDHAAVGSLTVGLLIASIIHAQADDAEMIRCLPDRPRSPFCQLSLKWIIVLVGVRETRNCLISHILQFDLCALGWCQICHHAWRLSGLRFPHLQV